MRAALTLLGQMGGDRPSVAILGTMRELGAHAEAQHREIAQAALASGATLIAAMGDFVAAFTAIAPHDPRVVLADDLEGLWAQLAPRLPRHAVILLKGSRGVQLERLVPHLTAWATPPSA
jgi:UDP-N-acetylmuramoyl-tripeptide--D-alanyl-D-alanine ligase